MTHWGWFNHRKQESANYTWDLPPIFVNEVLLEHNLTHSSCCSGGVDISMTWKAIFSDPLQKKKMIIITLFPIILFKVWSAISRKVRTALLDFQTKSNLIFFFLIDLEIFLEIKISAEWANFTEILEEFFNCVRTVFKNKVLMDLLKIVKPK